jgi:hypothetical protein
MTNPRIPVLTRLPGLGLVQLAVVDIPDDAPPDARAVAAALRTVADRLELWAETMRDIRDVA